jgi:DNA primase
VDRDLHASITDRKASSRFPMIQDRASLMWVINLGCIDLNPVVRDVR